ncbi:hypothetical protein J5837_01865 [Pseudoxanthomonas helianthi]|uniref:Uncharacterized protein n=1 Tax=Pseudoxanthomonas helianthi TaxID=1453541 RepID=A0A940WZH3_9GAMM|nr:hypothetical protein [Pseudoxanthomonas helianthi]MBP3983157.1 hypothetical protein [Pseudoxanthomonas helianthi]
MGHQRAVGDKTAFTVGGAFSDDGENTAGRTSAWVGNRLSLHAGEQPAGA